MGPGSVEPGSVEPDTATLVINSDSSYCSACGGGALIDEKEHLTLLPREVLGGWIEPPEGQRAGCGAVFTATATDSFMPVILAGIPKARPDLPFLGTFGMEAQA